ncbi:MAG: ABC-ATPase UvrA, partial [Thermoguttaceae bacterium]
MAFAEGTRMMILAPLVRGRKGQHKDVFESIRKTGFVRARVDGQVIDVDDPPELVRQRMHHIEAVVDRVVIREGIRPRIAESINLAIRHGDGLVLATHEEKTDEGRIWHDQLFSTLYACPNCKISYEELEPRTFSFNSPYGACPKCEGLGAREAFDPDLVVPDVEQSLSTGAVGPWKGATPSAVRKIKDQLREFMSTVGFRWNTPLVKLKPKAREQLLLGDGKRFLGVLIMLEKEYATTTSDSKRRRLETFRGKVVCAKCDGTRLRPEARSVLIADTPIYEVTAMTVTGARQFFEQLEFDDDELPIAQPVVGEIASRLEFLDTVGLEYLSLDRPAETLSGGELQRVRLATGLGSGLVGVCYVLDEPSIGLHPRDNNRLIDALRNLQARGNTVVVVEHDETIMRRADWLIDLGPGAGQHGGHIVVQGTPDEVGNDCNSLTGRYLTGKAKIPLPEQRRRTTKTRSITIEGVATNNLKNVTVRVPLSALVCVTGVSGSGKSSLLNETLARALFLRLGGIAANPGPHTSLRGTSQIDKVVQIDQSP